MQELGILALIKRKVRLLTANGDDLTDASDPSRNMMRQIAGAFHEYEKARLVNKLKVAREAKKAVTGKCGGRKTYAERDPAIAIAAKALAGERPRLSLREIAERLFAQGYGVTLKGQPMHPYPASSVRNMLAAK